MIILFQISVCQWKNFENPSTYDLAYVFDSRSSSSNTEQALNALYPEFYVHGNICLINIAVCERGERIQWIRYPGHLLLGRSYAILTDVVSPVDCQNACLLDRQCRSIQFIASLQQCSISYYSKDQAPASFRADSEVDYYEIVCVADR